MLRKCGQGVAVAIAIAAGLPSAANAANDHILFASVGAETRAPIGWIEFCNEAPSDCRSSTSAPRDIVMTQTAWRDLLRVNRWVNETVKPLTDIDHWGVVEKWS